MRKPQRIMMRSQIISSLSPQTEQAGVYLRVQVGQEKKKGTRFMFLWSATINPSAPLH